MDVHICQAENVSDTQRQMAADGIKQALQDLVDFNAIPGWHTTQWWTDFNLTCDGEELLGEWSTWRSSQSMDDVGCWLLVHDCNTSVANSSGKAWENDLSAIVKVTWEEICSGSGAFKGISVHEVLHTFIDDDCDEARDLMKGDDEHTLGDEHNPSNKDAHRTPMVINYELAGDGDCDNTIWGLTDCYGKPWLNNCEKWAVFHSRGHFYGRH